MATLLVALLALGQNPAWPATPDATAESLSRPEAMPGDPDYAPRADAARGCGGQLELYGFTPGCTPMIAPAERELGSGAGADRAWLLTRGSARVTLAILDGGTDWSDRELAGKWRLDDGELPPPQVGGRVTQHDRNGDGAFTPLDYTSATGTVAPTADRVIDDRLLGRADRGDLDGNGVLDPRDLQVVFADGIDDDGDGLVDESSGWDFVDDDADASGTDAHGPRMARVAAAETNNGLAGAGACPRCTVLSLRVTTPDGARGELYADAIMAASLAGAQVIVLTTAPDYTTSALEAAVREARGRGALVIVAAGDRGGVARQTTGALGGALVVSALGHDAVDRARATTALAAAPRASQALERGLGAPGESDGEAAALVAGIAGLVLSAADGAASAPALSPPLSPGELQQILESTATDRDGTEWSLASGAGRVSARAAVESVLARAIPPVVELVTPLPGSIADPTPDLPLAVEGRITSTRAGVYEWALESAVGVGVSPEAFGSLAAGGASEPPRAQLPVVGSFRDPTAPPGPPLAYAITTRLTATARNGAAPVRATVQRVTWAHRDLTSLPGFPRAAGGPVAAHPRAFDVDGDGAEDVLVATTDGSLTWLGARGDIGSGWPVLAPSRVVRGRGAIAAREAFAATPAIAVLGAGERPSIVALTESGSLLALDRAGVLRPGFPVAVGPRSGRFHAPAVQDLDGDGVAEIVVASADGVIDLIDGRGMRRAGFPVRSGGPLSAPAVARRQGIVVVRDGVLEAWSVDGVRLSSRDLGLGGDQTAGRRPAAPGPVLARGRQVYAAALGAEPRLDERSVAVLDSSGFGARATVPSGTALGGAREGELAVADLDGDGELDVVAGAVTALGSPVIAGWSGQGGAGLEGFPLEARLTWPVQPGIVDLDGDGRPEAIFADDHLRLRAVSADGRSPRAWPKLLPSPLAGVVVADLLGESRWVVVAVTAEGSLHAWRTEGPAERAPLWDGPRHDRASTGDLEAPIARRAAADDASSCAVADVGTLALLAVAPLALLAISRRRRARTVQP